MSGSLHTKSLPGACTGHLAKRLPDMTLCQMGFCDPLPMIVAGVVALVISAAVVCLGLRL
jgi:hypothetical protein